MWNTEALTIRKAKAGDHAAFAKLYDHHSPLVYRLLYRLTGNIAAAEDLTQDTFLAAYRQLSAWRGEGKFSTYLCGIAVRQYGMSRRHLVITEVIDDSFASSNPLDDPLAALSQQEAMQALEQAIAELPSFCREVYLLIRVEGMSYKEAAAIVHAPIGTVQSRLWRAGRLLQAALAPFLTNTDPCNTPPPIISATIPATLSASTSNTKGEQHDLRDVPQHTPETA